MKSLAIALIVTVCMGCDLAILAAGVWLTFFLGHSFWRWALVLVFSWGETIACYRFVNAVNGIAIPICQSSGEAA